MPVSVCEKRLYLNPSQLHHSCVSPWAALDLNALSPRPKAGLPPGSLPPRTLCRLPARPSVCRGKKKACPDTSEVWPSHRLLKQSPLINIYGLTDGRGSLVGEGGTEIVWRNNHHHPFTSTSSLSISLKWK